MPCPENQPHVGIIPDQFSTDRDVNKTGFVMEFDASAQLVMSTPIGGLADSLIYTAAADPKGGVFIQGFAQDKSFPSGETLMGSLDETNFFTFRLDTAGLPHGKPMPTRIVNAMTFAQRPMSPGSFATLFGSGLGPVTVASFALGPDGLVPTEVAGVQVTVAGVPAPVLYAQDTQINFIVPQSVKGSGDVCVIRGSDRTCVFSYIETYDPGVFPFLGTGYTLIFNQDGGLNTTVNPAVAGSYITVWGAGFGPYTRSFADGAVTDLPLAYLAQPVTAVFHDPRDNCVGIGGTCQLFPTAQGEVSFAGAAPFAVNGLTQINIKLPSMPVAGRSTLEISNSAGSIVRVFVSIK